MFGIGKVLFLLSKMQREITDMNATLQSILKGQEVETSSLNNLGTQVADLVKTDVDLKTQLANLDPNDPVAQQKILDNQSANNDKLAKVLASLPVNSNPTGTTVPPVVPVVPVTSIPGNFQSSIDMKDRLAAIKSDPTGNSI